jgi:hypothetical protein
MPSSYSRRRRLGDGNRKPERNLISLEAKVRVRSLREWIIVSLVLIATTAFSVLLGKTIFFDSTLFKDAVVPGKRTRTAKYFYSHASEQPTKYPNGGFNIGETAVLTYASHSFYDRLENLVGSVQLWAPEFKILVIDMGLNKTQKQCVRQMNGVDFWDFDFRNYPKHVRNLRSFAWKPIVIAELLQKYSSVIVQDAGQEFRSPPNSIQKLLQEDGYFFVKQKSIVPHNLEKDSAMTRYISVFQGQESFFWKLGKKNGFHHIAGGVNGWVRDSLAHHQVLLPSLECALTRECAEVVEDQHYMSILVHYSGLNYQEAGKWWVDWRLPWFLTKNPFQYNDIALYSRKFQCPKPYSKIVSKKLSLNPDLPSLLPIPHVVERKMRMGEGCNFQYEIESWNRYFMSEMKNYYKGERVFLIGNAPSLNHLPMHLLKNEHTLSFNNFFMFHDRINWRPTMYMCIDSLVCPDIADNINKHMTTYRHAFIPRYYKDSKVEVDYTKYIKDSRRLQWLEFETRNNEVNQQINPTTFKVKTRGTVASVGLEVLAHLGFSEIIVIGVDMDYNQHKNVKHFSHLQEDLEGTEDTDQNHFDPRYFGKGSKFHAPRANLYMLPSFIDGLNIVEEKAKQTAQCERYIIEKACHNHRNCGWRDYECVQLKPEIDVYNAGWGGALPDDKIPRKQFRTFFPHLSLIDEYEVFGQALAEDFNIKIDTYAHSLEQMLALERFAIIKEIGQFSIRNNITIAPSQLIISLLPLSIETHITRGPINSKCVLISRKYYKRSTITPLPNSKIPVQED